MKVAIYSGDIPSTTFIERLILGLAESGTQIILFGKQVKKINYPINVKIVAVPQSLVGQLIQITYYSILLFIFFRKEKKQLDNFIQSLDSSKRAILKAKLKFYPILYFRPNIFHLQWAKTVKDWMWIQDFGMKLIVSLRGAHINYSPIASEELAAQYLHCFPKIDAFHGVSNAIIQEASKYGANLKKSTTIYSGLDLNQFSFSTKPIQEPFNIVSVGRDNWKKGYLYALDAMVLLKEKNLNFHYEIIGGKSQETLYHLQSYNKLNTRVSLHDRLPFEAVKKKMKKADLLLLPSLEEGIANVVLEAMALGTLVLSTNCGGMNEVIKHGQNGFLVPVRDAKAIADNILDISQKKDEDLDQIRIAARKTIEMQHKEEKMVKEMANLYQSILK